MSKEFVEDHKKERQESTQEDRVSILTKLLQLIGKENELGSFLERGGMGIPQRGSSHDSFYMLSGVKGGARIIGLGKLEDRFVAYLSEGTHEEMTPIEIKDQAKAEMLIDEVRLFL